MLSETTVRIQASTPPTLQCSIFAPILTTSPDNANGDRAAEYLPKEAQISCAGPAATTMKNTYTNSLKANFMPLWEL
uniref:Uncharacterized protein n=1 Tax=Romanomermis culicivorax TaxID=13658 RepID=A0A915IGD8_ROMCU